MGHTDKIDFGAEFYGLPEFFVQKVLCEAAGEGLLRAYHWSRRGNVYVPLFTAVLTAADMVAVGSDVREIALHMLAGGRGH